MTSLARIRINSKAREVEERLIAERKRGTLVLVLDYLLQNGYVGAMQTLQGESGVSGKAFRVTENIDLDVVVRGFEDYFQMKFGKRPKLFCEKQKKAAARAARSSSYSSVGKSSGSRSTGKASGQTGATGASVTSASRRKRGRRGGSAVRSGKSGSSAAKGASRRSGRGATPPAASASSSVPASSSTSASAGGSSGASAEGSDASGDDKKDLGFFSVSKVAQKRRRGAKQGHSRQQQRPRATVDAEEEEEGETVSVSQRRKRRLEADGIGVGGGGSGGSGGADEFFSLRLMKPLAGHFSGEYKEYAESIRRDIIVENPGLYWTDIVGLEKAKQLTTEAVVLPIKYPDFFTGVLRPWTGVLLFGPPGTGKTMLAKAVATECKTTFFNISASTIVSKWRGDSEKLVRVLFELARFYAPSTIFIDEIDAILSQRRGNEHEASRRMKTELLIQMDGVRSACSDPSSHIFILAASNLPWDLDAAVLRRLEKRILVGLPNPEARETIFRKSLADRCDEDVDFKALASRTGLFSGADIVSVCKEGLMRPVRRILSRLESVDALRSSQEFLDSEIDPSKVKVGQEDLLAAIEVTKPSGNKHKDRYELWNKEYGAHL